MLTRICAAALAATIAVLASVGIVAPTGAAPSGTPPVAAEDRFLTTFPPVGGKSVTISDKLQVLSPADKEMLRNVTTQAPLPPAMTHVDFVVLNSSKTFGEALWEYAQQSRPELLLPDRTNYADGHLVVAVNYISRNSRDFFGFASGTDVQQAAQFTDHTRNQGVLAAMSFGLGEFPYQFAHGMAQAIRATADPHIGEIALQQQETAKDNPTQENVDLRLLTRWDNPDHISMTLWDRAGKFSSADIEALRRNTLKITLPPEVKTIDYILFDGGLNGDEDSYEASIDYAMEHYKDSRPDLFTADGNNYAEGHLIIAVMIDPEAFGIFGKDNQYEIYGGNDVAQAIGLNDSDRLNNLLRAGTSDINDERYADGMARFVTAAADPNFTMPNNLTPEDFTSISIVATPIILILVIMLIPTSNREKAKQSRSSYKIPLNE